VTIPWQQLEAIGLGAGLCAVGVTSAESFPDTLRDLEQRKAAGLHGGIQFTYRNPQRSTNPSATMPASKSLVVGALDYSDCEPARPHEGPMGRVASYSWHDHYRQLRASLEEMADHLRALGRKAEVFADQNNLVDRAVAHRAGIGWWGKSSNILIPGSGSMVVLGAVLTDCLITGHPTAPMPDQCGTCDRCLVSCPTDAIVSPGVVDARRCLAWLLQLDGDFPEEFRESLGDRIYGCDDCQDACPPNQIKIRRSDGRSRFDGEPPDAWVPILDLLNLDDQALIDQYGRWYIPRRDPDIIRRNAYVVLGNIGDGADHATRAAINSGMSHRSEVVRTHAAWAASRLGLERLTSSPSA